jgi:hypothetical protein
MALKAAAFAAAQLAKATTMVEQAVEKRAAQDREEARQKAERESARLRKALDKEKRDAAKAKESADDEIKKLKQQLGLLDRTCVVCKVEENPKVAFLPCGHRCVCSECALSVMDANAGRAGGKCPVCRKTTERFVTIYDSV